MEEQKITVALTVKEAEAILEDLISDLSEDIWAAGWMTKVERDVWFGSFTDPENQKRAATIKAMGVEMGYWFNDYNDFRPISEIEWITTPTEADAEAKECK